MLNLCVTGSLVPVTGSKHSVTRRTPFVTLLKSSVTKFEVHVTQTKVPVTKPYQPVTLLKSSVTNTRLCVAGSKVNDKGGRYTPGRKKFKFSVGLVI